MSSERKRSRFRSWLIAVGTVFGVLTVVIFVLPTIASSVIVPGIIQSSIAGHVDGKVTVSGTSFSWLGSQRIDSIKIEGANKSATDLNLKVKIEQSLIALLFNSSNLGRVDVGVSGTGTLYEDGSTSLTELFASQGNGSKDAGADQASNASPKNGSLVPSGFNIDAHVTIESFKLAVEGTNDFVTISDSKLVAGVQAGGAVEVTLDTNVASGGKQGTLGAKFELLNGIAADGRLQLASAKLDGSVTARDVHLPTGGQWVTLQTMDLAAKSDAVGTNVALTGKASGTFAESSPIGLNANMDLGSLVGPDGGLVFGPESLSGSVDAQSFPTSLLQPFLGKSAISLVRDVGPELNLKLAAGSGSTRAVHVELDAAHVKIVADMSVDEQQVSGGTLTMNSTLNKAMLEGFGLDSDGDVSLTIQGTGLSMKLAAGSAPDLDSLSGSLALSSTGALLVEPKLNMRLTKFTGSVTTDGLANGVSVRADGDLAGAKLATNVAVTNLVQGDQLDPMKVQLDGTASITGFDPVQLEALLGDALPHGALTQATGGPLTVDAQLKGTPASLDITAKTTAANIQGTADVQVREAAIQLPHMQFNASVTQESLAAIAPEISSYGALTSPTSVQVTGKDLVYELKADSEELQDRMTGSITGTVGSVNMALVNPAEAVVFDAVAVNVALAKGQPMQVNASGKLATANEPLASFKMVMSDDSVNADIEIDNVSTVAAVAGMNPGPLQVALGSTATAQVTMPLSATKSANRTVTGTLKSSQAQGKFDAVIASDAIRSANVTFSTVLDPGDLKKALGEDSAVRLVNKVPVSMNIQAVDFPMNGKVTTDSKATMSFSADSMQITGEDNSTVNIRGIKGDGSVLGRSFQAQFSATVLDGSPSGGKGQARLVANAQLPEGDKPFQLGDTKLQLDSVPTLIFELVGSDGRIAEAALGKVVNSKATIQSISPGKSSVNVDLSSPYATFEVPSALIQDAVFEVDQQRPITAQLKVSPELSTQLLSVVHPIFADIASTNQPFQLTVAPLALPLTGDQASKLNGVAQLDIGEVVLRSTDFGAGILGLLGNAGGTSVPAKFSPLKVTATNGVIEYKDFVAYIGQGKQGAYAQELRFDGKIDLASNPPTVIGISASFPATNLASVFPEVSKVPAGLLSTLRPKVTFYGPLYDQSGNRIPLKKKIDPLSIDDGLTPDQVGGIIKGITDLIRKKND